MNQQINYPGEMRRLASLSFTMTCLLSFGGCAIIAANPGESPAGLQKSPPASSESIRADLDMLSKTIGARSPKQPEALQRAEAYLEAELQAAGFEVTKQPVLTDKNMTHNNLVVSCGETTSETIVVGAHYDSWEETPGADDNASGTAVLLELARLLQKDDAPCKKHRISLVFYTLEEPPYFRTAQMGSAVHAKSLADAGTRVKGMICLEMVGYYVNGEDTQTYPTSLLKLRYPSVGNFLAVVGRGDDAELVDRLTNTLSINPSLPVYGGKVPASVRGVDFSDHLNYWAEGYTAVMVTDTAFLRNHAYHEAEDTPDRLDPKRMASIASGLWTFLSDF